MIGIKFRYFITSNLLLKYIALTKTLVESDIYYEINNFIVLLMNIMFFLVLVYILVMEFKTKNQRVAKMISIINVGIYIICQLFIGMTSTYLLRIFIITGVVPSWYKIIGKNMHTIRDISKVVIVFSYMMILILTYVNYFNIKEVHNLSEIKDKQTDDKVYE